MKYSIIVPVYNGGDFIEKCINNLLLQKSKNFELEILVIDDCSTDETYRLLHGLSIMHSEIIVLTTNINSGPGTARNIGVKNAAGDWIMFVDSDDTLDENALDMLDNFIKSQDKEQDIIAYNFKYDENSSIVVNKAGRTDLASLAKNKNQLIQDYLSLYMDGSVIYTLISKKLLDNHNIHFFAGLHEDVDYMFKVYVNAINISFLDYPIYMKNNRATSIVNSITSRHIEGFFRAYIEIYKYMHNKNILSEDNIRAYYLGLIGLSATRIREIYTKNPANSNELYELIYREFIKAREEIAHDFDEPAFSTKYFLMHNALNKAIKNGNDDLDMYMNHILDDISNKSWSCYDLHHSLFLAPDEIRTCCKRFFDDNKLKGDVSILNNDNYSYSEFTLTNILKEKKNLYLQINKGESKECTGCPFLEFKEWEPLARLDIEYISFEYHSICNMKCTYCSDTYYDGKTSKYNVSEIVNELVEHESLNNCKSIVWGGGEPTLDNNFPSLLDTIASKFPNIKQRVITNSTVYMENVKQYIDKDKVFIVTSVDAGSVEQFKLIRNNKNFDKVIENLVKYSANKADNVTIKYIVLDENKAINEIEKFVEIIKDNNLQQCNFQISFDFKKEYVDFESAVSIIVLYGLLVKLNVRLVFFDDLLRNRLHSSKDFKKISARLNELGYHDILANPSILENIVIWGAGNQTKNLLTTTEFFKSAKIAYLVDDTPSKIGTKLMGYDIYEPSRLKDNNYPVVISAVQASPQILEQFKKLNLDENRIIKSLIL